MQGTPSPTPYNVALREPPRLGVGGESASDLREPPRSLGIIPSLWEEA